MTAGSSVGVSVVLDASAVLVLLLDEPGAEVVATVLSEAC